ncbi:hypothetical protein Tco_1533549 [Tanacetum coccineum]
MGLQPCQLLARGDMEVVIETIVGELSLGTGKHFLIQSEPSHKRNESEPTNKRNRMFFSVYDIRLSSYAHNDSKNILERDSSSKLDILKQYVSDSPKCLHCFSTLQNDSKQTTRSIHIRTLASHLPRSLFDVGSSRIPSSTVENLSIHSDVSARSQG